MNKSLTNTALITGASLGIGREFSILLAKKKYNLVLVALEADLLDELTKQLSTQYQIQVFPLAIDLAQPGAAAKIAAKIEQLDCQISVLINNAGVGFKGDFCHIEAHYLQKIMMVNMVALTELTKYFVSKMKAQGYGRILNISSTAAFQPGPGMAVYFASKAYILSFSQALAEELHNSGVTVTALCPGPTITEFAKNASLENSPIHKGLVPLWYAEDVAKVGYQAMMAGKRITIVGIVNKLCRYIVKLTPKIVVMRRIKKLHSM